MRTAWGRDPYYGGDTTFSMIMAAYSPEGLRNGFRDGLHKARPKDKPTYAYALAQLGGASEGALHQAHLARLQACFAALRQDAGINGV